MIKLKIATILAIVGAAVTPMQAASAQSDAAKLAAARACSGQQWWLKGYNSYQDCTADYINYYPELPPSQDPV